MLPPCLTYTLKLVSNIILKKIEMSSFSLPRLYTLTNFFNYIINTYISFKNTTKLLLDFSFLILFTLCFWIVEASTFSIFFLIVEFSKYFLEFSLKNYLSFSSFENFVQWSKDYYLTLDRKLLEFFLVWEVI